MKYNKQRKRKPFFVISMFQKMRTTDLAKPPHLVAEAIRVKRH